MDNLLTAVFHGAEWLNELAIHVFNEDKEKLVFKEILKKICIMETNEKILLKQGAEARIYISTYDGNKCIVKERFIKNYRHPELDAQITKERINAELKAIKRCETKDILVPKVLGVDHKEKKLYIEYIENSITVKQFLLDLYSNSSSSSNQDQVKMLCNNIGCAIAKMHSNHIIHGDLTTSNMLINHNSKNYEVIMIDFGLSHYNESLEDKAVDLYVLERALLSTHGDSTIFEVILENYKSNCKNAENIIKKLQEVRSRGRKRNMVG